MNLVLQGPQADAALAGEAAKRHGARAVEQLDESAFRLRGARKGADPLFDGKQVDVAWVPEGRRFADLSLVAMDMDSTLITIECIDELGDAAGKKPEIAAITARAMRGEIDYPQSLRARVRLLAGIGEDALARVYSERLRLSPGAERLVAACKAAGIKILLVSGGFTYFTGRLKDRLGLDDTVSNVLGIRDGKLTGEVLGDIVDGQAKAAKFRAMATQLNASREQTLAIGDGANDLPMLAEAGLSVAYRAKPVVRAKADCALDWSGLDGVLNLLE